MSNYRFIVPATRDNIARRLNELKFPDPEKSKVARETIEQLFCGYLIVVRDEKSGKSCHVKTFKPKK